MLGLKTINPEDLITDETPAERQARSRENPRDAYIRLAASEALSTHKGRDQAMRRVSEDARRPVAPILNDVIAGFEGETPEPDDVFKKLRWGGEFLYVSRRRKEVQSLLDRCNARGFLAGAPERVWTPRFTSLALPNWFPFASRAIHYFVARKVSLVLPREYSDRFTYHVHLVPHARAPQGFVVQKEVPSVERVMGRLRHKFPDTPLEVIEKRARKFTEKIFPVFLTREAAILRLLERDLPGPFRRRVPHLVSFEKDERGLVRKIQMNWLRNAGKPISQIEFARQSAELLHALHEKARIVHMDLRLDNFVVTEHGVGFVDFGSAVRIGENLRQNPIVDTIFQELMKTSQIQRMLEQMTQSGAVTSRVLTGAQGQVDKAADLFYLAVQINNPLTNPEFKGLIDFDPNSQQASALAKVTEDVLKPKDPNHPAVRDAGDLLDRIAWAEKMLR